MIYMLQYSYMWDFCSQIKGLIRHGEDREVKVWERLISGSAAGAFAQTTIYPMEVSIAAFYFQELVLDVSKFHRMLLSFYLSNFQIPCIMHMAIIHDRSHFLSKKNKS